MVVALIVPPLTVFRVAVPLRDSMAFPGVLAEHFSRHHVTGQHFRERFLVFRLQQRIHGAGGEHCEYFIRRRKNRERSGVLQSVHEPRSLDRGYKCGVIGGIYHVSGRQFSAS